MNVSRKQAHQETENRLVVSNEGGGVGLDWEFGTSRRKLLNTEWRNSKVLLYSRRSCTQYHGINREGKEYVQKNVHLCITESRFCTAEVNTL